MAEVSSKRGPDTSNDAPQRRPSIKRSRERASSGGFIRPQIAGAVLGVMAAGAACAVDTSEENLRSSQDHLTWAEGTTNDNYNPKIYAPEKMMAWITNRPVPPAVIPGKYHAWGSLLTGGTWSPAKMITGPVIGNLGANIRGITYGKGGACGTGKMAFASDENIVTELSWGDFDVPTLTLQNSSKLPATINISGTDVVDPEFSKGCTEIAYAEFISGANTDLRRAFPGVWIPTTISGANTSFTENGPGFCGPPANPNSKLCFGKSGGIGGSSDIMIADYNSAAPSVTGITALLPQSTSSDEYSGNTDDESIVYARGSAGARAIQIEVMYPKPDAGVDSGADSGTMPVCKMTTPVNPSGEACPVSKTTVVPGTKMEFISGFCEYPNGGQAGVNNNRAQFNGDMEAHCKSDPKAPVKMVIEVADPTFPEAAHAIAIEGSEIFIKPASATVTNNNITEGDFHYFGKDCASTQNVSTGMWTFEGPNCKTIPFKIGSSPEGHVLAGQTLKIDRPAHAYTDANLVAPADGGTSVEDAGVKPDAPTPQPDAGAMDSGPQKPGETPPGGVCSMTRAKCSAAVPLILGLVAAGTIARRASKKQEEEEKEAA